MPINNLEMQEIKNIAIENELRKHNVKCNQGVINLISDNFNPAEPIICAMKCYSNNEFFRSIVILTDKYVIVAKKKFLVSKIVKFPIKQITNCRINSIYAGLSKEIIIDINGGTTEILNIGDLDKMSEFYKKLNDKLYGY